MNLKTIVVGYDDSPESQRALEAAADIGERFDAKLVVTSSAPVRTGVGGVGGGPDPTDSPERHQEELVRARAFLGERKLDADLVPAVGSPEDAILELAKERGADLIVVGSHEHGIVSRMLGGSVSSNVLRHAPCSVLIVH